MPRPEPIRAQIEALAADHFSGASAIAQRGAYILRQLVDQSRAQNVNALRAELIDAARSLVRTQPTMIPLLRLANSVLWSIEALDDLTQARCVVASICEDFIAQAERAQSRIAQCALETIPARARLLTHSFSSTVLTALLRASQQGRLRQVVCTESGPQMEGTLLAARLAAEGMDAPCVPDEAAAGMVARVDAIWVGADGLSERDLVNKIGTQALASAAHQRGVPFYTLCSTDKIAPEGYLWPQVAIAAELFDTTPLELISAAICEEGRLTPRAVREYAQRIPLHPLLG